MLAYTIILSLICFMQVHHSEPSIDKIADLQWKHRIVLGVVESEAALNSAMQAMQAQEAGIIDRKIAYFLTNGTHHLTNYEGKMDEKVWQEITQLVDDDKFVLIGLDGSLKARYQELNISEIFSLIDTMPMRRKEIQRKEKF